MGLEFVCLSCNSIVSTTTWLWATGLFFFTASRMVPGPKPHIKWALGPFSPQVIKTVLKQECVKQYLRFLLCLLSINTTLSFTKFLFHNLHWRQKMNDSSSIQTVSKQCVLNETEAYELRMKDMPRIYFQTSRQLFTVWTHSILILNLTCQWSLPTLLNNYLYLIPMITVITRWRPGFHVSPIHQGFVVEKLALRQFFLHTFWLTLSLLFHKCSISVHFQFIC